MGTVDLSMRRVYTPIVLNYAVSVPYGSARRSRKPRSQRSSGSAPYIELVETVKVSASGVHSLLEQLVVIPDIGPVGETIRSVPTDFECVMSETVIAMFG